MVLGATMPTELPPENSEPPVSPQISGSERRPRRPAEHDGGSFPIAVVADIPIRIHLSFLLLLAFLGFQYFGQGTRSLTGILFIVGLFFCVILHELGHAIVAGRYGIRTLSITLYPI